MIFDLLVGLNYMGPILAGWLICLFLPVVLWLICSLVYFILSLLWDIVDDLESPFPLLRERIIKDIGTAWTRCSCEEYHLAKEKGIRTKETDVWWYVQGNKVDYTYWFMCKLYPIWYVTLPLLFPFTLAVVLGSVIGTVLLARSVRRLMKKVDKATNK